MSERILVHVEDDSGWANLVQEGLEQSGFIEKFIHVENMEKARAVLARNSYSGVLIVDLQLSNNLTNFDGMDWLIDSGANYVQHHKNVHLFVISGQLHPSSKHALIRSGILEERIYDKGKWADNQNKFFDQISELNLIDEEIDAEIVENDDAEIYEVGANFENVDDLVQPLQFKIGETYKLEVTVRSLLDTELQKHFINDQFVFYIHGHGATVKPREYAAIRTPQAKESSSFIYSVYFSPDSNHLNISQPHHFNVYVYHNRHLVSLLQFLYVLT